MRATFRKSFTQDLKKIRDQTVLDRVRQTIEQIEAASNLREIGSLRKLRGTDHCYRIRIGDYRIGVAVE